MQSGVAVEQVAAAAEQEQQVNLSSLHIPILVDIHSRLIQP
jgi:hypothetical protein